MGFSGEISRYPRSMSEHCGIAVHKLSVLVAYRRPVQVWAGKNSFFPGRERDVGEEFLGGKNLSLCLARVFRFFE